VIRIGILQCRLQVRLRLPPELLLEAQHAERVEQIGIHRMLGEPFLGLLDQRQRLARHRAIGIAADQAAIPMRLQTVFDDALGVIGAAKLREIQRRLRRNARRAAFFRGQLAPEAVQRIGIVTALGQQRFTRHLLESGGQHGMDGVALFQGARQTQHLAPVLQMLMRTQGNALRLNLPRALRLQLRDLLQRTFRIARVDQQFGHRHKLRLLTIGRGDFGHPRIAALGLLHPVCGTGTDQRGRLALRFPSLGFARLALRMAKAPGKEAFHCLAQRRGCLQDAVTLAIRRSTRRHPGHMVEKAHHKMQHHKRRQQRRQHEIERHLHPVRRVEQHDVAKVQFRKQCQPDGGGKQERDPEYPAHAHSLPEPRTAARLSASVGTCSVPTIARTCDS
jgi:hypothetical protein